MTGLWVQDLSAGYGGRPIVEGLTLPSLDVGEVVSVVGPNGAGKSTFLRALAGLIPAKGSIRLDEVELTGLSLADRAKRVTYMPQTLPQGVALTVLETVVAAIRATPLGGATFTDAQAVERAFEVLQRIGAEALAGQRLDRLSGGQKQLVVWPRPWRANPACCCSTSRPALWTSIINCGCWTWRARRRPSGA